MDLWWKVSGSIYAYLVLSRYLSLDFGRADLVGKILECSRDKFRMVMEVLNSREEHTGFLSRRSRYFHSLHNKFRFRRSACYQQVTVWAFHERRNGWPRWTRLPWWPFRSYPPGSILGFCLAVRCWLEDVKIPLLGGISAAPKVLSSPLSFKSGRCNEYDRPISDDTTGLLGWTNGHPLLKVSLYPAPLENLFQVKT